MWPHRRQPTRLPHPWDSPGKNAGVGCHFLLQCMKVKSESEVTQSCPTLSDPMDCSSPGFSVHGIFQARVLEWGAIAFSAYIYIYTHTDLPRLTMGLHPKILNVNWKYKWKMYLINLSSKHQSWALPTLNMLRMLTLAYGWAKAANGARFIVKLCNSCNVLSTAQKVK